MADAKKKQWSGQSRGGKTGYQIFAYIIKHFGVNFAYTLLAFVVAYFVPFAPKATRSIWNYNRKRLKMSRLRSLIELYRHYYIFGQVIIDKMALHAGLAEKYHFEFDNYDEFIRLISGNQGVVIIGAHVGNWEAGSVFFEKYGKKINIVYFDSEAEKIKKVLENRSTQSEICKIIFTNNDPIEALLKMKVALNNGEYVCIDGDRYLDKKNTLETDFLGEKALFPSGPFLIATKCRVPIVFYYAVRERNKTYRFIFENITLTEHNGTQQLLKKYTESLEKIVKKYPNQWFNFYDFWQKNEEK